MKALSLESILVTDVDLRARIEALGDVLSNARNRYDAVRANNERLDSALDP